MGSHLLGWEAVWGRFGRIRCQCTSGCVEPEMPPPQVHLCGDIEWAVGSPRLEFRRASAPGWGFAFGSQPNRDGLEHCEPG